MALENVKLSVPAEADYARSVRMLAATLAVSDDLSVDDVEDVRMAAEEGFVYACSTFPERCDVSFTLGEGTVAMDFVLGSGAVDVDESGENEEQLELVELLLSAICDEFEVSDQEGIPTLHLLKKAGHVE
jgi:serine/threonine-protein kinase RsbW